jgi:hypothetical protein
MAQEVIPDLDFFISRNLILDPGVKKALDSSFGSATLEKKKCQENF